MDSHSNGKMMTEVLIFARSTNSVADPYHGDTDPDPGCEKIVTDPDPDPGLTLIRIRILAKTIRIRIQQTKIKYLSTGKIFKM